MKKTTKYVIFDLDETLGYFTELGIIWNCLQTIHNVKGDKPFFELCSLFEKEYFRPGIFKALHYLKNQGSAVKVILYTNNTGEISWLRLILKYMEKRANANGLFHTIVPGYKPNMTGITARTSFDKTYDEIRRCARIPADAKIIFFDDLKHNGMVHHNVTYRHVKPFFQPLRPTYIVSRLQKGYFGFLDYGTNSYLYKCIRNFHTYYLTNGHHMKSTRVTDTDVINPLKKFLRPNKSTAKRAKSISSSKGTKTRKNSNN